MSGQRGTANPFQAHFGRLHQARYEISLQGCRQGPIRVLSGHLQVWDVAALPGPMMAAALDAGASDYRIGIEQLVAALRAHTQALSPVRSINSRDTVSRPVSHQARQRLNLQGRLRPVN